MHLKSGFTAGGVALVCALGAGGGAAQNFPVKVVRYVVPFTAGSGADTLARIVVSGMG